MDKYKKIKITKPYAVIGDIHGCYYEFKEMVDKVDKTYGKNTMIISVGDTIDRGDYNLKTMEYTMELFERGRYLEVQSNHNDKFVRWLKGRNVKISYGMQKTVDEFLSLDKKQQELLKEKIINFYEKLPLYLIINENVVIAHAGIKDEYIGRYDKKVKSFVLYGETTGKFTPEGFPERIDWTKKRKVTENSPKIVYGHVVFPEPYVNNKCYGIDTGCVLGNKLTAFIPDDELFLFVRAKKQYYSFE